MTIRVLLFAGVKELLQSDAVTLELPDSATIADVRKAIIAVANNNSELLLRCMFAVDSEFASDETPVTAQNEIACIPPVSGG